MAALPSAINEKNETMQKLPAELRFDIAMVQRDLRELERNFLDIRMQFETQSRQMADKAKELNDKYNELKRQAEEFCAAEGGEFDEAKLECKPKAKKDERPN